MGILITNKNMYLTQEISNNLIRI